MFKSQGNNYPVVMRKTALCQGTKGVQTICVSTELLQMTGLDK